MSHRRGSIVLSMLIIAILVLGGLRARRQPQRPPRPRLHRRLLSRRKRLLLPSRPKRQPLSRPKHPRPRNLARAARSSSWAIRKLLV